MGRYIERRYLSQADENKQWYAVTGDLDIMINELRKSLVRKMPFDQLYPEMHIHHDRVEKITVDRSDIFRKEAQEFVI